MASKAALKGYKKVSVRKGLKRYTYLGCPMTKNRSPWCFRMCKPNTDGTGACGRVAPHGFRSRIQQGIADFQERQAESTLACHNQEPACGPDL
jgi:hypothetical protein